MSFATSAIALQGVGAASSVIGSFYGAQSQKSTLEFNARISELNAQSQKTAMGYQADIAVLSAQAQKDTMGYQAGITQLSAQAQKDLLNYNAAKEQVAAQTQKDSLGFSADIAQLNAQVKKDTYGFTAAIASINADVEEKNAQATLGKGERDYGKSRLETAQAKGKQRASFAARGVDLGVGSTVQALAGTDVVGEIAAKEILVQAVRQAWGHRQIASTYETTALIANAMGGAINPQATGDAIRTQAAGIDPQALGDAIRTQAGGIDPQALGDITRTQANAIDPMAVGNVIRTQAGGIDPQALGNIGRIQASGINPLASALGTFVSQGAQLYSSYSNLNKVGAFGDTPVPVKTAPAAANSWWSPVPSNFMQSNMT